jgi:hypothetical protein
MGWKNERELDWPMGVRNKKEVAPESQDMLFL